MRIWRDCHTTSVPCGVRYPETCSFGKVFGIWVGRDERLEHTVRSDLDASTWTRNGVEGESPGTCCRNISLGNEHWAKQRHGDYKRTSRLGRIHSMEQDEQAQPSSATEYDTPMAWLAKTHCLDASTHNAQTAQLGRSSGIARKVGKALRSRVQQG